MEEINRMQYKIEELIDKARNLASTSPDEAIKLSNEALSLSRSYGFRKLEGYSLITIALSYRVKSEIGNILDYSLEALQIFEVLDDNQGKIKALNLAGVSYFYSSMYEEALRYFSNALDLAHEFNEYFLESSILNNIAEIYRETLSYNKAFENYEKALIICKEQSYNINIAVIYGNIGDIHMKESRLDQALEYFNEGIKKLNEQSDPISFSEMENRIGRVSQLVGDKERAEQYYIRALDRLTGLNHKYYAINILTNLASLYLEDKLDKSMEYYIQAINIAKEIDASNKISQIYIQIAELQEVHGNYLKAIEYYKLYSNFYEKHLAVERGKRLEILHVTLKHTESYDQLLKLKNRFEEELKLEKHRIDMMNEENLLLEKNAYEDELTGVLNRRSIKRKLKDIVDKAQQDNKPVTIYMIDVDNFKKYNDYWGHLKGDSCLIEISKCIHNISSARGEIFGRYGGEEFLYISRAQSLEDAYELGEVIRKSVEQLGLYYDNNGTRISTTISIGAIVCKGETLNNTPLLFEEVDRQLYKSKKIGKNQVSIIELVAIV